MSNPELARLRDEQQARVTAETEEAVKAPLSAEELDMLRRACDESGFHWPAFAFVADARLEHLKWLRLVQVRNKGDWLHVTATDAGRAKLAESAP